MIQFPNCKINLGLRILKKRADAYHDLQTIFYPLGLQDALEFIPSSEMKFSTSGIFIPGSDEDNLILKAYKLVKAEYPLLPLLNIYLLKNIPTGAGLGGGSSNASFMIMMLNKYFQLEMTKPKILEYALQLGSDCPFFIYNIPCFAEGRGEILKPIQLDLSAYSFVLVKPKIHIKTSWAFSQITPQQPQNSLEEIILKPIVDWPELLKNDFEPFIFQHHPTLANIKEKLYQLGACYSSLSGTGSTLYGIFEKHKIDEGAIKQCFNDCEVIFI